MKYVLQGFFLICSSVLWSVQNPLLNVTHEAWSVLLLVRSVILNCLSDSKIPFRCRLILRSLQSWGSALSKSLLNNEISGRYDFSENIKSEVSTITQKYERFSSSAETKVSLVYFFLKWNNWLHFDYFCSNKMCILGSSHQCMTACFTRE